MDENKAPIPENGVKISDDVVQIIAGIATTEIDGVFSLGNTIAGGIADFLGGKKNNGRGVRVDIREDEVTIDVHVIVKFGVRIPDVAWNIQEKVKDAVETMTGLRVPKVNIHIDGINIEKEPEKENTPPVPETEEKETEEE